MTTPLSTAKETAIGLDYVRQWIGKGCKTDQSKPFWLSRLRISGVEPPAAFTGFSDAARMDTAPGFISGVIPSTRVPVGQAFSWNFRHNPICQSNGALPTPCKQYRLHSSTRPRKTCSTVYSAVFSTISSPIRELANREAA